MSFKEKLSAGLTPIRVWLLVGLAIVVWRIGDAPTDYDLSDPSEQAMRTGALLASDILDGETEAVRRYVQAGDEADRKLAKPLPNLSDVLVRQAIETSPLPARHSLWDPIKSAIYAEGREHARIPVRLRTFERVPGAYVMTFAALSGPVLQGSVELQGTPMMASVFIRHIVDKDDYAFHRVLGRKIANAFWMHEHGVMGNWLLVDFDYNFNRRTYFDFVLANAAQLALESKAKDDDLMKDLTGNINATLIKAKAELVETYAWASKRMRQQQAFVANTKD